MQIESNIKRSYYIFYKIFYPASLVTVYCVQLHLSRFAAFMVRLSLAADAGYATIFVVVIPTRLLTGPQPGGMATGQLLPRKFSI